MSRASLCSCPGALLAHGQSAAPQFRTGVELLQLDVAVLDNKRQPVSGLTAADFTVLDNGVETPIRAFTPIELARPRPAEAVWANDVAPDVVTNQVGEAEGRLVVILMDRTIPIEQPTVTARKIATAAVESLGPHDLAAVVSTNNSAVQTRAVQNLTADRARLRDAINAADPSTGMSGTAEGIMNMPGSPFKVDPLNDSRCLCGLCVLETVTRVAEAVGNTPRRRKVMLFIGSSMIWQSSRPIEAAFQDPGCESRLKDARGVMFAAIDRANLVVHSIDPQGLVNPAPQSQGSTTNRGPASALQSLQSGLNNSLIDRGNMSVLPDRTGGRAVLGRNNPELTIPDIFRESDSYYVIAVERAVSARSDAARNIQVKVGRKGLRVVAQRQYVASTPAGSTPAGGVAPTIEDALNGLLPNAGVPLALGVTAFSSTGSANPVVRVNVDAGAFARADGAPVSLDVAIAAVDRTGKPVASARQTSTIAAKPPAAGPPIEVNVQSQLELPPGDYGLRVALSDAAAGKVASVFAEITVPEVCRRTAVPVGIERRDCEPWRGSGEADHAPRVQARRSRAHGAPDLSGHSPYECAGAGRDARAHPRRQGHGAARSVAAVSGVVFCRQPPHRRRDYAAAGDARAGRVSSHARRLGQRRHEPAASCASRSSKSASPL